MARKKDWEHLGVTVAARRNELGLTQEEAAHRGGTVSLATWRKLENGGYQNFSSRVLAGVARAMRWTPRSIDRVLVHEEPTETIPTIEPLGTLTVTETTQLEQDPWWISLRAVIQQLSARSRRQVQQTALMLLRVEQDELLKDVEQGAKFDTFEQREEAVQELDIAAQVAEQVKVRARSEIEEMLRDVRTEIGELLADLTRAQRQALEAAAEIPTGDPAAAAKALGSAVDAAHAALEEAGRSK